MSKWGNNLFAGKDKPAPDPDAKAKKEAAARRADEKVREGDRRRGHTYESVMHPNENKEDEMSEDKKDKAEKFRRVAAARTTKVVRAIRLLGKCADPKEYAYTQDQARDMMAAVYHEINIVDDQFKSYQEEDAYAFCFGDDEPAEDGPQTATDDEANADEIGGRE